VPAPATLPALLNHSGTNVGSLLSITKTEHHQKQQQKNWGTSSPGSPPSSTATLVCIEYESPSLPCTSHYSSITQPNQETH